MTLKNRLENIDILSHDSIDGQYYSNLNKDEINEIEKIAEDFAIGFSTWISVNYYSIGEERWVSWKKDIDILSSKELLKIYKKEKTYEC